MADRITSLWKRLAEMYGAKALETKFGATPPDTWRVAIDRLKDFELERGMRRLVYGGKAHIPSLPEFLRMAREVGGDDHAAADHRPAPQSHQITQQPHPQWLEQANRRLLAYFAKKAARRVYFLTPESVQPFINAKNYWAQDMREATATGSMPVDNGKAWWNDYFAAAEKQAEFDRKAA
jgi:hypothetical protein